MLLVKDRLILLIIITAVCSFIRNATGRTININFLFSFCFFYLCSTITRYIYTKISLWLKAMWNNAIIFLFRNLGMEGLHCKTVRPQPIIQSQWSFFRNHNIGINRNIIRIHRYISSPVINYPFPKSNQIHIVCFFSKSALINNPTY
jgi:hypothetical protein